MFDAQSQVSEAFSVGAVHSLEEFHNFLQLGFLELLIDVLEILSPPSPVVDFIEWT